MPKQNLTAAEAARALGISLDTLRRWDRAGKIHVERDSANRRTVPSSELERLSGGASAQFSARNRFRGVVRSVVMRNLTKYSVNFVGVFVAYAIASGRWLTEDWLRRLLPTAASVVLVALLIWFGLKFAKGSKKAAVAVKRRRVRRAVRRTGAP